MKYLNGCVGLAAVAGLIAGAIPAEAHDTVNSIHFVGLTQSRMHGAACRPANGAQTADLKRYSYGLKNQKASERREVFCPVNRRNLSVYGDLYEGSRDGTRTLQMYAQVNNRLTGSSNNVSCRAFAYNGNTQSISQSTTRYACSSVGGCSTASSFSGDSQISWYSPFGSGVPDVHALNLGVSCNLSGGAILKFYGGTFYPTSELE